MPRQCGFWGPAALLSCDLLELTSFWKRMIIRNFDPKGLGVVERSEFDLRSAENIEGAQLQS